MPDVLWTKNFCRIWFAQIVLLCAFFGVMPIIPVFLVEELGVEGAVMGLVTAMHTGAALITRPVSGYFIDRYGRMILYVPSFIFMGLLFFFYPLVTGLAGIILLRLAHGALWGTLMGAANTLAVDLIPPARRGEGIGMFGMTMNLGQATGPAIAVVIAGMFSYNGLFIYAGIVAVAGFALVVQIRPPVVLLENRPFSWKRLLERTSLPASLVVFLVTFPFGVMMNYSILYCRQEVPDAKPGIMFLLVALGMGFARFTAGKAFDRSGPEKVMALSFFCYLCALCLNAFTRDPLAFYAFGLFMGAGCGTAVPVCQAMVNFLAPPQRRGAANATCLTAFDGGVCCGLLVIGYTQKAFGWPVSHGIEFLLVFLAILLFWGFALPHYRRSPHPGRVGEREKAGT